MDKVAKGLAERIINELGAIKRLIHDAISLPRQKHPSANDDKNPADDEKGNPKQDASPIPLSQSQMQPAITQGNNTKRPNVERFHWLTECKPLMELVGVIGLLVYTTIAAFQWCAMLDSNKI